MNVARFNAHSTPSLVARTDAARGQWYMRASSPKKLPGFEYLKISWYSGTGTWTSLAEKRFRRNEGAEEEEEPLSELRRPPTA